MNLVIEVNKVYVRGLTMGFRFSELDSLIQGKLELVQNECT